MTITQLTNNGTADRPDIFGNQIVWTENDNDIVLFDGINRTLLPNLGVRLAIKPQISAEGILWEGWVNGWNSFYYDGTTTTQVTNKYTNYDEKLSGNRVAWREGPKNNPGGELFEVYLYDGSTDTTLQLTNNDVGESPVDIDGQNVVWNGSGTVYLYDGTSTTTIGQGISPYVSGNQVVWESYTGGISDQINLYDGNTTTQIANDDSIWLQGFFDGNVIWTQWDGNDFELFRYDGNTTVQITDNDFNDRLNPDSSPSSSSARSGSAVDGSGDRLVWSSYVNGNWEIFYYDGTETIQVTDNNIDDLDPKISGDRIVWNTSGATSDIFLYKPDTNPVPVPVMFADDFELNIDQYQWQEISNGVANNNFAGDGNSLYFSGGGYGGNVRFATSNALDLTEGGSISFDIIFGDSANGGENADGGEDVVLEYSIDDGTTWNNLGTYDTEDYTSWSTQTQAIPAAAQTDATQLRWRQVRQSGSNYDNWGLDNVQLVEKSPSLSSLADNFDLDIDPSQWSEIGNSEVNNNFGGSGNSLFFTNGTRGDNSRSLTTAGVNVTEGGEISFELIFGDSSNGGENADGGEDVILEYSVDDGANWQEIAIYDTEAYTNWTGISETVPTDAQTDNTLFRWMQLEHSGSNYDNWGLDNIQLVEKSPSLSSITDNFDPDIDPSQWSEIGNSEVNNNFGGSGNSLFFTNGTRDDNSRSLTTTGVNVTDGGEISFELIFGDSSNGGENADGGEDVILEYSVDDGANWQEIAIYDTEAYTNWAGISETVPTDAQTDNTLFRWMQLEHSGSNYDNWGLDNIQIDSF